MAKIDDLLEEVGDAKLRAELRRAVKELRNSRNFGLVFEEHIPEEVALPGLPVRQGSLVQIRTRPDDTTKYEVVSLNGTTAAVRPVGSDDDHTEQIDTADLMVVRRFGEPIYPGLTEVDSIRRGPDSKPAHAVINAENFHALQLLTYTHAGKVDVIYIDPPYNTGARDWKYNNRYVDANDQWRHSKWLSMMEKRIKLAQTLLKPDGVLIVTIDEHEVHHLGVLLEQALPGFSVYTVTIVHNPKGTYKRNFARVNEYAMFCVPEGEELVGTLPEELFAQVDTPEEMERVRASGRDFEDLYLRRRGQESGYRHQRPNQFYAILVDESTETVVGVGPALGPDDPWEVTRSGSVVTVYPLDTKGEERVWRYNRDTMQRLIEQGDIVVTGFSKRAKQGWILNHRVRRETGNKRLKTVWWEKRHDAGAHGSDVVNAFLGEPGKFPFPKSLYAVRDCLMPIVANRPDAVILDFFAGSGTTFHATALLNLADGGQRRSILVTNNEVEDSLAARLIAENIFPGDPRYEEYGIFQAVTMPRVKAAISGSTPAGDPVEGEYTWAGRRPFSEGLEENVSFLRLDYLDPDVVGLGRQYKAIAPLLWLAAGAVGQWADREGDEPWSAPPSSNYAVLFDEDRFPDFREMLEKESGRITHVWLVTNSSPSFVEMRAQLPDGLECGMLYRDYLMNFRVNTTEMFE